MICKNSVEWNANSQDYSTVQAPKSAILGRHAPITDAYTACIAFPFISCGQQ